MLYIGFVLLCIGFLLLVVGGLLAIGNELISHVFQPRYHLICRIYTKIFLAGGGFLLLAIGAAIVKALTLAYWC
ncbi:hypothetical protein [Pseudomonas phage D6]|nr:hypothetical protein [Pseudomonas phage D6]